MHHCDVDACDYKAKQASDLKRHKAHAHDIGVVWHNCDVGACDYKAKQATACTASDSHVVVGANAADAAARATVAIITRSPESCFILSSRTLAP